MTYYGKLRQLLQWKGAPAMAPIARPPVAKPPVAKPPRRHPSVKTLHHLSHDEQKGVNESLVKLRRGRETLERNRLL